MDTSQVRELALSLGIDPANLSILPPQPQASNRDKTLEMSPNSSKRANSMKFEAPYLMNDSEAQVPTSSSELKVSYDLISLRRGTLGQYQSKTNHQKDERRPSRKFSEHVRANVKEQEVI